MTGRHRAPRRGRQHRLDLQRRPEFPRPMRRGPYVTAAAMTALAVFGAVLSRPVTVAQEPLALTPAPEVVEGPAEQWAGRPAGNEGGESAKAGLGALGRTPHPGQPTPIVEAPPPQVFALVDVRREVRPEPERVVVRDKSYARPEAKETVRDDSDGEPRRERKAEHRDRDDEQRDGKHRRGDRDRDDDRGKRDRDRDDRDKRGDKKDRGDKDKKERGDDGRGDRDRGGDGGRDRSDGERGGDRVRRD